MKVSTIITDMDNTLYNWVEMWYQSFSAMLHELVAESGIDQAALEAEIRQVYQKYGTSEYRFLIQELPSLKMQQFSENSIERYQSAIQAYEKAYEGTLCLYPLVMETLEAFKARGCQIVAYTESMAYYTVLRVKNLHLDGILDFVYSSTDHDIPSNGTAGEIHQYSAEYLKLKKTVHRDIPAGELKPNPGVLRDIIRDVDALVNQTIYVGDNLMKDIVMAQNASVTDVLAKYGGAQRTEAYQLLRRVSHWTKKDVERERSLIESDKIHATYVLDNSFSELLDLFEFIPFSRSLDK